MAAEDYEDVPGFGSGTYRPSYQPKSYTCHFCKAPISFSQRKAFNKDGSPHRCKAKQESASTSSDHQPAVLYAMAAMSAIINAQIQQGGIDHVHRMNFYDVADAAWQAAAAMVSAERNYRHEFGGGK